MQRRGFDRHSLTVPLYVSFGGKVYHKQVRLQSKNISGGGLAFETSRRIPRDANTRVLVSGLGDLPQEVVIEGRVAYRVKNEDSGRYTVGIAFTNFVNVERGELLEHIERWEGESQLTPI